MSGLDAWESIWGLHWAWSTIGGAGGWTHTGEVVAAGAYARVSGCDIPDSETGLCSRWALHARRISNILVLYLNSLHGDPGNQKFVSGLSLKGRACWFDTRRFHLPRTLPPTFQRCCLGCPTRTLRPHTLPRRQANQGSSSPGLVSPTSAGIFSSEEAEIQTTRAAGTHYDRQAPKTGAHLTFARRLYDSVYIALLALEFRVLNKCFQT